MNLQNLLAGLVDRCRRHAALVVLGGVLLAALSVYVASTRLGVTTDTDVMFAASLPWRQEKVAFDKAFPQFQDLLVAVIDADAPEEAEATATALAAKLSADPAHFRTVRRPDASPYLRREGLLFLDKDQLQTLMDSTIDAQPFLGQLVADPSARGLFAALSLLGIGVEQGQADLAPYATALEGFHKAMAGGAGRPRRSRCRGSVCWAAARRAGGQIQVRAGAAEAGLRRAATGRGGHRGDARRSIAGLEFVKSGQARVRITGSVALADEEFATVAQGAVTGLAVIASC